MIDPRFAHGIKLFNEAEYFDCHEVLELLWKEQSGPPQQLTQSIIQIAVGLYHQSRDNYVGASKLLRRGLQRLEANRSAAPLDVDSFIEQVTAALSDAECNRRCAEPPTLIWTEPVGTD